MPFLVLYWIWCLLAVDQAFRACCLLTILPTATVSYFERFRVTLRGFYITYDCSSSSAVYLHAVVGSCCKLLLL
jgi:hypothetical protein